MFKSSLAVPLGNYLERDFSCYDLATQMETQNSPPRPHCHLEPRRAGTKSKDLAIGKGMTRVRLAVAGAARQSPLPRAPPDVSF
jgi:hypothetical protein